MNFEAQQRLLWDVVRGERAIDAETESAFRTPPRGHVRDRLQLYADMYRWRHLDALRAVFPLLSKALGDRFEALSRDYTTAHPSRDPSIDHVGRDLPAWLSRIGRAAESDLASFELARAEVFDEADVVPLPFAAFVARAHEAPSLRLRFVRAVRLVRIGHSLASTHEGLPAVGHQLVWRRVERVVEAPLSEAEATALRALQRGATLGEACEAFASEADPAVAAARAVGSWFSEGLVEAIG